MSEKLKKVLTVIASIILWIVILVAALFAFTTLATKDTNHVANLFGFTPMTVQSDSMVPTFQKGDLIIIKKTDPATLQVGDIVTFHTIIEGKYALNTHRITSITDYGTMREFVTKGDNNPVEDSHNIVDGDIVGKYVGKIPFMGKVVDFLSKPTGFLIVVVLPLLLFFIYQVYHLIMVSIQIKKASAVEAAEAARKVAEQGDSEADKLRKELEEAKRKLAEAEAAQGGGTQPSAPQAAEVKPEEPKAEEVKAEEPKTEEPKTEEPKVEEEKAVEVKAEEVKAEEPKAEEVKPEEPKVE